MNECLAKFVPVKYRDDFKHDLFEILIKHSDKVIEVYRQDTYGLKNIRFYVVRCIISLATQKRNLLQAKYIKKETDLLQDWHTSDLPDDNTETEKRRYKEDWEDNIINRLKESENILSTPYYRLLAEALMINGTAGKVAKATGIPKSSVQQGIKKIRQYLSNE